MPGAPDAVDPDALASGIEAGDRRALARGITLVESTRPDHQDAATALLERLLPRTGGSSRLGISGPPGVGKSTFIEAFGLHLVGRGHQVAVLAVDPTSSVSGGSILGDKTRMAELGRHPAAFIRPSPGGGQLGGVARRTREALLLCEAFGFDVVIVETVGVGQSETAVADMVDFFLVLLLAGGGDDLQGIKKGVIEIADMIAINKADGDNVTRAGKAAAEYQHALQILSPRSPTWHPPVVTISGRDNKGLDDLWARISDHRARTTATGEFVERRQAQAVNWMHDMLEDRLMAALDANPTVAAERTVLETKVRSGELLPTLAVDRVMALMGFKA